MSGESYIRKLYQGGMNEKEIAEMLSDNNPVFAKMDDAMRTVNKIISGTQRPALSKQTIKEVQLNSLTQHTPQFLSKIPKDQREAASLYGYAERAKVVRANIKDVQELLKIKNKTSLESVYPKYGAWIDAANRVGYKGSPVPPSGLRYHTAQQLRLNRLHNPTPTYAMGGSNIPHFAFGSPGGINWFNPQLKQGALRSAQKLRLMKIQQESIKNAQQMRSNLNVRQASHLLNMNPWDYILHSFKYPETYRSVIGSDKLAIYRGTATRYDKSRNITEKRKEGRYFSPYLHLAKTYTDNYAYDDKFVMKSIISRSDYARIQHPNIEGDPFNDYKLIVPPDIAKKASIYKPFFSGDWEKWYYRDYRTVEEGLPKYALGGPIPYLKKLFSKPNVYKDILDKSLYPRGHYNLKDSNISLTSNAAASLTRQKLSRQLSKPTLKQRISQNKNNLIDVAMASGIIGAGAYAAPYLGNIAGSLMGSGLGFAKGGSLGLSGSMNMLDYIEQSNQLQNLKQFQGNPQALQDYLYEQQLHNLISQKTVSNFAQKANYSTDPLSQFTTAGRSLKGTGQSIYPNLNFLPSSRTITPQKDSRNLFGVRYGHFSASLRSNGNLRFTLPKHFKSPFVNGNLRIPRYLQLSTQTGLFGRFAGRRFAGGGLIRGPGTGTSDSIPTTLPPGYVIPTSTMRAMGSGFFGGGDTFQPNGAGMPARVSNGEYFLPQSSVKAAGGTGFFDRMLSYTRDSVLSPSESSRLFRRGFAKGGSSTETVPMMEYGTRLTVQGKTKNEEVLLNNLVSSVAQKLGKPAEEIRKYAELSAKTVTTFVNKDVVYKSGGETATRNELVADTVTIVDATVKLDGATATKLGDKTGKIIGDSVQKATGKTKKGVLERKDVEELMNVRVEKQLAQRPAWAVDLGKKVGAGTDFTATEFKQYMEGQQRRGATQQQQDVLKKLTSAGYTPGMRMPALSPFAAELQDFKDIEAELAQTAPERKNAMGTMARFSQGFQRRQPSAEAFSEPQLMSSLRSIPLKISNWFSTAPTPWDLQSQRKAGKIAHAAGGHGGGGTPSADDTEGERLIPRHRGDKAKSRWGTIGWTAASLSMSSMGVYFSILGLVTSIQSAVSMLTNAVMDLNKAFQASGYLRAFGKSIKLSDDQIKAVTGSSKDLVETWKKVTALQSYMQTMFANLATKLFNNPRLIEAITKAFTNLFDKLSQKDVIESFAKLLTNLVDIIPNLIPAFQTFASVLEKISENKALVQLASYAFVFSMLLQPLTSLISAFGAMMSVMTSVSALLMTTATEATLTGRSFFAVALGADAASVGLTGMNRGLFITGMALRGIVGLVAPLLALEVAIEAFSALNPWGIKSPWGTPIFSTVGGALGFNESSPSGYAIGGEVNGPGDENDDKVPALLSDGEYVINAKSARKLGRRALDKLNKLATGGSTNPISIPQMGIMPNLAAENKAADTREYSRKTLSVQSDIDNSTAETNAMIKGAYASRAHHVIVDNANQFGNGSNTGIGIDFAGQFDPFDWLNIPMIDWSSIFKPPETPEVTINPNVYIDPIIEAIKSISFPIEITSNIQDIISQLEGIAEEGILHINLDNYDEVRAKIQELISLLEDKNLNINVSVSGLEQFDKISTKLHSILEEINIVTETPVEITVNTESAVTELNTVNEQINRALENLNNLNNYTVSITVDTSALDNMNAAIDRALSRPITPSYITPTPTEATTAQEITTTEGTATSTTGGILSSPVIRGIGAWLGQLTQLPENPLDIIKDYTNPALSYAEKTRWPIQEVVVPDPQDLMGLISTGIATNNEPSSMMAEAANIEVGVIASGAAMKALEYYGIANQTGIGGWAARGLSAGLTSASEALGTAALIGTAFEGQNAAQLIAEGVSPTTIKTETRNPVTGIVTGGLGYAASGSGFEILETYFKDLVKNVTGTEYTSTLAEAYNYYRPQLSEGRQEELASKSDIETMSESWSGANIEDTLQNTYDLLMGIGTTGIGVGAYIGNTISSASFITPAMNDALDEFYGSTKESSTALNEFTTSSSTGSAGVSTSSGSLMSSIGSAITGFLGFLNPLDSTTTSMQNLTAASNGVNTSLSPLGSSISAVNTSLSDGSKMIGASFDQTGKLIDANGQNLGLKLDATNQILDSNNQKIGLSYDKQVGIIDASGNSIGASFDTITGKFTSAATNLETSSNSVNTAITNFGTNFQTAGDSSISILKTNTDNTKLAGDALTSTWTLVSDDTGTAGQKIVSSLTTTADNITSYGDAFAQSLLALSQATDGFTYTWLSHADETATALDTITDTLSSTYGNILTGSGGAYTVDENGNIQYVNNDISGTYDTIEAKKAAEQDELNKQFVGTERTTSSMSYWQGALSPILTYLESYSLGGTRSFQEALTAAFAAVDSLSNQDTMADFAKYLTGTGGKTYEQWLSSADLGENQSTLTSLLSQYPTALAAMATSTENTTSSLLTDTNTLLTGLQSSSVASDGQITTALNTISTGVTTIQDAINTNSYIEPVQNIYLNITVEGSMDNTVSDRLVATVARELGLNPTKW